MSEGTYESDWVGGPVAPLAVGETVYVEVWDSINSQRATARAVVKGTSRTVPDERCMLQLAVELEVDVRLRRTTVLAGDVIEVALESASRSESVATMPINSEFTDEHIAGLPEVRLHQGRIVHDTE